MCPVPTLDLRVNGSNNATVPSGSTISLTWSSQYVSSCTASGSWTGNKATNNSVGETRGPLSSSAIFALNCTGSAGDVSDSVTVTVTATPTPTPQPPTANISANPTEILRGGSSILTWSSTNADFCIGSGGWTGNVGTGGTTSVSPNVTTVYHIDCVSAGSTASDSATVTVNNIPWWQAKGGSVFAQTNIYSPIPPTCTPPLCNPYLILDGGVSNQYSPGLAIFGGSSFNLGSGGGLVSSKNWLANSSYTGKNWTYSYFVSLIPRSYTIHNISSATIGDATLDGSAATDDKGYTWYKKTGDLTISGDVTISGGKKVILLVEGNLTINGKINLDSKEDFFMAIVGQRSVGTGGNIIVGNTVTASSPDYALEGIYFADNNFNTGNANTNLRIKGSVSANTTTLARLGGDETTPSELFEYAPEIMVNYPDTLNPTNIAWKETAP